MDLQATQKLGKRWSLAKLAAFLCFAIACGFLAGSLAHPVKARSGHAAGGSVDHLRSTLAPSPRS